MIFSSRFFLSALGFAICPVFFSSLARFRFKKKLTTAGSSAADTAARISSCVILSTVVALGFSPPLCHERAPRHLLRPAALVGGGVRTIFAGDLLLLRGEVELIALLEPRDLKNPPELGSIDRLAWSWRARSNFPRASEEREAALR